MFDSSIQPFLYVAILRIFRYLTLPSSEILFKIYSTLKHKRRRKSGNACYHSVQDLLSSSFPCKYVKIKVHRILSLTCFYGCEISYLTRRKEHRLKVFENRVLRKIFGPKREEITGEWRKLRYAELYGTCRSTIARVIKTRRMI